MAFSVNEFPNTSYYDSDLREILKYMRDFEKTLDEYDEIAKRLDEALTVTIPQMNNRIDKVEFDVTSIKQALYDLDVIRSEIKKLNKGLSDLATKEQVDFDYLNARIDAIKASIDKWDTDITELYKYVDIQCNRIETNVYSELYSLRYFVNYSINSLQGQLDKLSSRLEYLITNLSYDVYNEALGYRIKFDRNNKELYKDLNDYGSTCSSLASAKISCGDLAKARWDCKTLFTEGDLLVTHRVRYYYTPWTGRFENPMNGLSAFIGSVLNSKMCDEWQEYDCDSLVALDLTVQDLLKF